jgi:bifunctional UDP-N-acetylglucosamine pyrophosphorylase/glucosamine-1-phosphate N-acetyltransferase
VAAVFSIIILKREPFGSLFFCSKVRYDSNETLGYSICLRCSLSIARAIIENIENFKEAVLLHIHAIVLAAGQGTRMKSKLFKVLHKVCGKPMVKHIVDMLQKVQVDRTVIVVGHGASMIKNALGDQVEYAIQEQQLGTGHAVIQTAALLEALEGVTLILYGDTPLLTEETIRNLIQIHTQRQAVGTLLTAQMEHPTGYGRVVRDEQGVVLRIVEEKDCTEEERKIKEINTGTYCFNNRQLFEALHQVTNDNAQGEYYVTDVIGILHKAGQHIEGYCMSDPAEATGVNDRVALSQVEAILRKRINKQHMLNGVTFINPDTVYIDTEVTIGADTVIHPECSLRGSTVVGSDCIIGPQTEIIDSILHDGVHVKQSVLDHAEVGMDSNIGPFAYLRPGTKLAAKVKIGDFVEVKNSTIGEGSKVPHLSYVGDAHIGKNVNIGCGSITANYDGVQKHITQIDDNAFIGSNSNLIAPIHIGKGAYVVAGSTITHNVADDELAIGRSRQMNKPGYAAKLKARIKKE